MAGKSGADSRLAVDPSRAVVSCTQALTALELQLSMTVQLSRARAKIAKLHAQALQLHKYAAQVLCSHTQIQ